MRNEDTPVEQPTLRKPIGMGVILTMIAVLGWAIGTFAGELGTLPVLVQAVIYLFAGIIWIAPLGPLLRWMETGKWRE